MFRRRKVTCVTSNKGGVGKTVVSIGLALDLATYQKITLLDLDVHGPDVLNRMGIDPSLADFTTRKIQPIPYNPNMWVFSADCLADDPGLGYLAKDEDKRAYVKSTFSTLDFHGSRHVVCDMPAGTDEILYMFLKEIRVDNIVIVTNPERSSVLDTEKLIHILEHHGLKDRITGIVVNMAYVQGPDDLRGCRFNDANVKIELCDEYDVPYIGAIPEFVKWDGTVPSHDDIYKDRIFQKLSSLIMGS